MQTTQLTPAQAEQRELLVFGYSYSAQYYTSGTKSFRGLSAGRLDTLIRVGLCDPEGRQNFSPTAAEFLAFMSKWPGVTARGYCDAPEREAATVVITGLDYEGEVTQQMFLAVSDAFARASKFRIGEGAFNVWWD